MCVCVRVYVVFMCVSFNVIFGICIFSLLVFISVVHNLGTKFSVKRGGGRVLETQTTYIYALNPELNVTSAIQPVELRIGQVFSQLDLM